MNNQLVWRSPNRYHYPINRSQNLIPPNSIKVIVDIDSLTDIERMFIPKEEFMNKDSTNNKKQYPDETGYSVPGTYTDSEWESYQQNIKDGMIEAPNEPEWLTRSKFDYKIERDKMLESQAINAKRAWDKPYGTRHTPEYYRKEGKPEWNLVDFPSLEPLVRALEYGKTKHGKFSYRNFIPKDILLDKLYRHLIEIHKGNFIDEETGEHHIGGVLANAMFYSYHHRTPDMNK